jgi:hypothetical protein
VRYDAPPSKRWSARRREERQRQLARAELRVFAGRAEVERLGLEVSLKLRRAEPGVRLLD